MPEEREVSGQHEVGYRRSRRERAGREVVDMFHEIDRSRPVFAHHGGGIDDVDTHNMPRVYDVPAALVRGDGHVGSSRQVGMYLAAYRYDFVYGDDPHRYLNWWYGQ